MRFGLAAILLVGGVALVLRRGAQSGWAVVGVPVPALGASWAQAVAQRIAAASAAACVLGGASWLLLGLPVVTLLAAVGGAATPFLVARARRSALAREAERAWSGALDQLADALEAGLAFPAAVALVARSGPPLLQGRFDALLEPLRRGELEQAIATLAAGPEQTARSAATLLRAALVDVPSGGLAPLLRELARVARERFDSTERARIRSLSLRREARVLAASPLAFLLLIGWSSPGYLDAYRTTAGTLVSLAAAVAIGGCYFAMLRLGRFPGSAQ
jgi:tight adherence protein B